jgi:hypothetical protein
LITRQLPVRRQRIEKKEGMQERRSGTAIQDRDAIDFSFRPPPDLVRELQEKYLERDVLTWENIQWLEHWEERMWSYDARLYTHGCAVACIAAMLAEGAGYPLHQQARAFVCGLLHDVGKMHIEPAILWAPQERWEKEREELMRIASWHAWHGYQLLQEDQEPFAQDASKIALLHHRHQRNPYPTDEELLELGIAEPGPGPLRDILMFVEVGDSVEASRRHSSHPERDDLKILPLRRRRKLIVRRPDLAPLICRAFDGIIVK